MVAGGTVDAAIAPFYAAVGKAMLRWQYVEIGLFIITHGLLETEYERSSVVFFHIQSADSKIQLADRLCRAFLRDSALEEWINILDLIREVLPLRNAMAHWEANFIIDGSLLQPGEPPVALTRHHLDIRAGEDTRGLTTTTLTAVAQSYLDLSERLMRFAATYFSLEKLHATRLPHRLLLYLEMYRSAPPTQPPPPRPSRGLRRDRSRAERGRKP